MCARADMAFLPFKLLLRKDIPTSLRFSCALALPSHKAVFEVLTPLPFNAVPYLILCTKTKAKKGNCSLILLSCKLIDFFTCDVCVARSKLHLVLQNARVQR
jgi:hypothetical protein